MPFSHIIDNLLSPFNFPNDVIPSVAHLTMFACSRGRERSVSFVDDCGEVGAGQHRAGHGHDGHQQRPAGHGSPLAALPACSTINLTCITKLRLWGKTVYIYLYKAVFRVWLMDGCDPPTLKELCHLVLTNWATCFPFLFFMSPCKLQEYICNLTCIDKVH